MQIETTTPEIISLEDFEPTNAPGVFIHADINTVVIVENDLAYRIVLTDPGQRR